MKCVLDASAALSFVLNDEFSAQSRRILDHVVAHGAVVPSLWRSEVANGLLSAWRRDRITDEGVAHALVGLERLHIDVDVAHPDGSELIALGWAFDLSAYDAAYLWLAKERQLPLATRDRQLAVAADQAGIRCVL